MDFKMQIQCQMTKFENCLKIKSNMNLNSIISHLKNFQAYIECSLEADQPAEVQGEMKFIFTKYFYERLLHLIIHNVFIDFSVYMKDDDYDELIFPFFNPNIVPAMQLFVYVCSTIAGSSMEMENVIGNECIRLLVNFMEHDGYKRLFEESIMTGPRQQMKVERVVQYVACVPDVVHNAMQNTKNDICPKFIEGGYYQTTMRLLLEVRITFYETYAESKAFGLMVDKLCRIGKAEDVCASWKLCVMHTENKMQKEVHKRLFKSLMKSSIEKIVCAFLDILSTSEHESEINTALQFWFSDILASKSVVFVLLDRLILAKCVPKHQMNGIVALLAAYPWQPQSKTDAWLNALEFAYDKAIQLWAMSNYVEISAIGLHASVTSFIVRGTATMQRSQLEKHHWISLLCKGVQDRMESTSERVRNLGLQVATAMSLVLDPENPIDFCLNDSDEEENTEPESAPLLRGKKKIVVRKCSADGTLNPNELVESSGDEEESNFGESYDSDESLEVLGLYDDEEDLLPYPKPVYLFDCLEGLSKTDDRDRFEVTFNHLNELIRDEPLDLNDLAPQLCAAVLKLNDSFSTPNFQEKRYLCLLSLCVCATTPSIEYLASQFLDKDVSFRHRVELLEVFAATAIELSDRGPHTNSCHPIGSPNDKTTGNMAEKVRRWGYRRHPIRNAKKNGFLKYSDKLFYLLLNGYNHPKYEVVADESLSSLILAGLLRTLSICIHCMGNSPPAIRAGENLLLFAIDKRFHKDAVVRRQVLFAFQAVFINDAIVDRSKSQLQSITSYLQMLCKEDPDSECRKTSMSLLRSGCFK